MASQLVDVHVMVTVLRHQEERSNTELTKMRRQRDDCCIRFVRLYACCHEKSLADDVDMMQYELQILLKQFLLAAHVC